MKWLILILGCILAIYEIVTLIIQIVKKRRKKKQNVSSGESEKNAETEEK